MTTEPANSQSSDALYVIAQAWLMLWQGIMERATNNRLNREDAINLVNVTIELTRLGYTLTDDETDWQPPTT